MRMLSWGQDTHLALAFSFHHLVVVRHRLLKVLLELLSLCAQQAGSPGAPRAEQPPRRAGGGAFALSRLPKRRQKSSIFCSSSAKSTVEYTHAFSLPLCSCSFVPGSTAPANTKNVNTTTLSPPGEEFSS